MRDGVSLKVDLPDFRRQLAELDRRMQNRVVGAGVRAAGRLFRDAARGGAPVLRKPDRRRSAGALRRSIVLARQRGPRGTIAYAVTVRASRSARGTQRDAFYWRFLEGGWIPRGPGNRLRGGTRRKALERSRLAAARVQYPFLEPAYQRSKGSALATFNATVQARLTSELQTVR